MKDCVDRTRDSNQAVLGLALETCLGELPVETPAVAATGTINIDALPANAETVTVNGTAYTFGVGGGEVENATSPTATATALAGLIDAGDADLSASSSGPLVTITAATAGIVGNLITMVDGTGGDLTLSGSTLDGGEEPILKPQYFLAEVNTFGDFGSELTKAPRSFINPGRQKRKGRTVGEAGAGGFQTDYTRTSINRYYPAFLFAAPYEMPSLRSIVRAVGDDYTVSVTAASGVEVRPNTDFKVGMIIDCEGFTEDANNATRVVTAVSEVDFNQTIQATPAFVDEAVTATQNIQAVGYQFALGDIDLSVVDGIPSLISTVFDFTTISQILPGVWIFIGDDDTANRFDNNIGYARVKRVTANAITFDNVNFTPVAEAGAGKSIRVFVGSTTKNENDADKQVEYSYSAERQLGFAQNGNMQAEYLSGCIMNELSIEFASEEKLAVQLSMLATKRTFATGETGNLIIDAERIETEVEEEVYNTTSDLVLLSVDLTDPASVDLEPLVGFVESATISVNNNATPNKALTVLGTLDYSYGDLDAMGTMEAYFQSVTAPRDIKGDVDAGLTVIAAYNNYGFAIGMPALTISGGSLTIEKDAPIKLPIEAMGVKNEDGYTLLHTFFHRLPDAAMPA